MPVEKPSSSAASGARTIVGIILLTVGVLATTGTVLAFFGSVWWAFDVISGYRMQMAVALVAAAILYGIFFARATALVFAVAAGLNLFLVVPLYTQSPMPAAGSGDLTVASYDTERATLHSGKIVDWLHDQNADIVFLFETNSDLVSQLEGAELEYDIYAAQTEERQYGITMLSRVDVVAESLDAGAIDQVLRAEADIGGEEVAIYATRAQRATSEEDVQMRDQTLSLVGQWAAAETMPVVVVGPLNASQWSYAFENLKSTARLTDTMPGFGFQPSWRADMWMGFRIPYDQALHSSQLTTKQRSLGPTLGSDHLPLQVTFAASAG